MSHEVIYLTGVPAVGKSTLSGILAEKFPDLRVLEYGAMLTEAVAKRLDEAINQTDLKAKSSALVTREDVQKLDRFLIEEVGRDRLVRPLLIDSHAVTIEKYGFRVIPFSSSLISALAPTRIVLLTAEPSAIQARISADSQGRPLPDEGQLRRHANLQLSVAVSYSVATGASLFEIDNSSGSVAAMDLLSGWLSK